MVSRRVGYRTLGILSALLGTAILADRPANAACGEFYRIDRGDTLRTIAVERLGHDRYNEIYVANRDIVSGPNRIEVGQLLYLPCAGAEAQTRDQALKAAGRVATARDNLGDKQAALQPAAEVVTPLTARKEVRALTVRPAAQPELPSPATTEAGADAAQQVAALATATPATTPAVLRVLTGEGLAPLTGARLRGEGLAPTLLRRALDAGGARARVEIAFVDDWKAHHRVLMPTGAFHFAFPWTGEGCEVQGAANEICQDFFVSRPVFQLTEALIAKTGDALLTDEAATLPAGTAVCRPEGLGDAGLSALDTPVDLMPAPDAAACAEQLMQGQVRTISLPLPMAQQLMGRAHLRGDIAEIVSARREVPVSALVWRDLPDAEELITTLNRGLQDMQASGSWFELVSTYLSDFNRGLASN